MEKVKVNLKLNSVQLRGFAALARYMCPAEIERIAREAGEAECILSALDEIQSALATNTKRDTANLDSSEAPFIVSEQGEAGKQTLKGLEDALLGGRSKC
jgi:hypothetical protein